MADLAARYYRAAQGCLDLPNTSDLARYLLAWIYQSPSRGVTPGLYRIGPGALSEEIGWTVAKVRKHLAELAGHVLVDEAARVLFVVGAIRHDPPRTVQQITAMARQFAQIPRCNVLALAIAELEGTIRNFDKSLIERWRELNCYANSKADSSVNSSAHIPTPTPIPTLIPIQIPERKSLAAVAARLGDDSTPTLKSVRVLATSVWHRDRFFQQMHSPTLMSDFSEAVKREAAGLEQYDYARDVELFTSGVSQVFERETRRDASRPSQPRGEWARSAS